MGRGQSMQLLMRKMCPHEEGTFYVACYWLSFPYLIQQSCEWQDITPVY